MPWPVRPLVSLTAFLAASSSMAQTALCPWVAPIYPNCPPATGPGVIPSIPNNPNAPPLSNGADAAIRDGSFSRSTEGGGLSAATAAPSMDGDLFGARSLRIKYTAPLTARFNGLGAATTASGGSAVLVNPNSAGSSIAFGPTPNGTVRTLFAPFNANDLSFVQPTSGGGVDFDRTFAKSALQTLLSTGQLTADQINQLNRLSPADRAKLLGNRGAINSAVTKATRGLGVPALTVSNVDGAIDPNGITYTAILTGERNLALPGSSSAVGRVKLAEDNSPMPKDRVLFAYDSFENVPFTDAGLRVNRFQFGFEKTFLDGRWSAEVRLPFAATLASTYTDGFETRDVEFGNLRFALKHLWTRSDTFNISSGVGVTLPTASDQVVMSPLGGELYRFKNQSVTVEPYVAFLYTPDDRFFAQAWSSINVDTSGGKLTWNRDVFGGSGSSRIWDLPYLALDGQLGYWLIRKDTGTVRGMAPFVELHWNYAVAQRRLVDAVSDVSQGAGLTASGIGNTELNLIAGVVTQLGDHVNLTIGGSAPLLRKPDRTFDAQFGLRLNYYFGASARGSGGSGAGRAGRANNSF